MKVNCQLIIAVMYQVSILSDSRINIYIKNCLIL